MGLFVKQEENGLCNGFCLVNREAGKCCMSVYVLRCEMFG